MVQVCVSPPDVAVSVAVCAVLTADTVAVKLAVVAPAATVTVEGTATAVLLLNRLTDWPPVPAAVFNVTVHVSVPALAIDPFAHVSPLRSTPLGSEPDPANEAEPQPDRAREQSNMIGKLENQLSCWEFLRPPGAAPCRFSRQTCPYRQKSKCASAAARFSSRDRPGEMPRNLLNSTNPLASQPS
jgi:hypothetical protein